MLLSDRAYEIEGRLEEICDELRSLNNKRLSTSCDLVSVHETMESLRSERKVLNKEYEETT
jgi:hypothetical protein